MNKIKPLEEITTPQHKGDQQGFVSVIKLGLKTLQIYH